tara:strand:+ start:32174 stop:32440 length:267 start_codon:yes stop_codon:yes gene_type:complete
MRLCDIGDGDDGSHLIEWLEEQLLVTPARDLAELSIKVDVLFSWITPDFIGMTEQGTDLLNRQMNSLRADLSALTVNSMQGACHANRA